MTTPPETAFATVLARCRQTRNYEDLAQAFFAQSVTFRLENAGASAPAGIGAHIRRSFLGALGPGASDAARAGKPCRWDPPSALDIFCREQLRGPRGDGLPKPYVVECRPDQQDLLVTLRVFGMANDWFMVAAEAMATGMRDILPWGRLFPGRTQPPRIISRKVSVDGLRPLPADARTARLVFISPTDTGGRNPKDQPYRLLARLQRRIDGISRWNGVGLADAAGRALAEQLRGFDIDTSELVLNHYKSPNARRQSRRKTTFTGVLVISGDIPLIWPLLAMGEACHLGRGAVEGLGKFILQG